MPTGNKTSRLRPVAGWNPFGATVQACRVFLGRPGVSPPDVRTVVHPVRASLIRSLLILVVFRTLAVRKYRRAAV
ncbi:hypothetical protein [Streptomyces sp. NPDC056921]|uniref:hypothetical protein n=1 Tax=Streptomyces sp. NPDC056921 TaxID=3345966 RepID=UPI0036290678